MQPQVVFLHQQRSQGEALTQDQLHRLRSVGELQEGHCPNNEVGGSRGPLRKGRQDVQLRADVTARAHKPVSS